jgi:hypothetical protein
VHAASASNGSCQITQGVVGPGKAAASGKFRGKSGERNSLEGVEVELLRSVVDVNAHDIAIRVAAFPMWATKARGLRTLRADVIRHPPIDRTQGTEYSMASASYGERLGKQSG